MGCPLTGYRFTCWVMAAGQGDSPCWVIVDVGRVRNLRGGKWGRGVWVCWVAFWKEEVVLGFNRNVQLYSRSWF